MSDQDLNSRAGFPVSSAGTMPNHKCHLASYVDVACCCDEIVQLQYLHVKNVPQGHRGSLGRPACIEPVSFVAVDIQGSGS